MKHNAKLISIMTEKLFEKQVIEMLEQEGVKGYTVFEGGGSGPFHLHQSQHISMVDEFKIIKLEVIVLQTDVAERLATNMVNEFFYDKPGIVSLTDVEIFRPQKF